MNSEEKICVIGGGSWATAIVKVLTENGYFVNWWVRRENQRKSILEHGHNPDYLSPVKLELEKLQISTEISGLVENSKYVILALPSSFVEEALNAIPPKVIAGKTVVTAVKGLIPSEGIPVSDFLIQKLGIGEEHIVALGGPCHAEEVASEKQSYLSFAGDNYENAAEIANMFNCRYISVNVIEDLRGFEYAAVLKNIYSIASGICHGAGMGDNFQAVLVSNCMREMKNFLESESGNGVNFLDTAYTGDLLVTTYSRHSRNRTFGNMIGRGYSVKAAKLEMKMIAEGYYALSPVKQLVENQQVEAPIIERTYNMVFGNVSVKDEVKALASGLK